MDKADIENTSSGNTEVADKHKKSILIKQVLFMCIGSAVAAFLFTDIFNLGMMSLSIILISVLFAYPIGIRKTKLPLLIIPCFMLFLLGSIVFRNDANLGAFFYVMLIVTAVHGMTIGALIKLVRTVVLGTKKSIKSIAKSVVILVLVVPILVVPNLILAFFGGHPFGAAFANQRIRAFVSEHFSDEDLKVGFPQHDWKVPTINGIFTSTVVLQENENVRFYATYRGNGRVTINHNAVVVYRITQILEEEFDDSVMRVSVFDKLNTNWFDDSRGELISITFNAEEMNPYTLSEMIVKSRNLIEENGFDFARYNINFNRRSRWLIINDLRSQDVNGERLLLLLEYLYENYISTGHYMHIHHHFEFPRGRTYAW